FFSFFFTDYTTTEIYTLSLHDALPIFRLILCLLLGTILSAPALHAQTTSTIEGTVTDRQGLAISGAEVSVAADTLAVSKKTITEDRKSTRLNSSHVAISYAVFCLKKKT